MIEASAPITVIADRVLRKSGLIVARSMDMSNIINRVPAPGEIVLETLPKLLVATAPCAELEQLGISGTVHEADKAELETETSQPMPLELPSFLLRLRGFDPDTKQLVKGTEEYHPFAGQKFSWLSFAGFSKRWKPFLWLTADQNRHVVGVRNGRCIVIGIDLFNYISLGYSCLPLDKGLAGRLDEGDFLHVDRLLLRLLKNAVKMSGTSFALIDPWPDGKKWAFSIRHDYDRLVTDDQLRKILQRYAAENIKSSWYILPHKRITHQIRQILEAGHEIGLHTTAANDDEFADQVSELRIAAQQPVMGVTAHGGAYIGFLGGHQVNRALQNDLYYTESLSFRHNRPYRMLAGGARGFFGLPGHHSLDSGTRPHEHKLELTIENIEIARKYGQGFILMSHPDVHIPQLFELLSTTQRDDAWLPTSFEMAQWASINAQSEFDETDGEMRLTLPFSSRWKFNASLTSGENSVEIAVLPGNDSIAGAAP